MTAETQNVLPRRILGPDNVKYLRDISRQITGDRFAFDRCRVQRNRFGGPATQIDVATLEDLRDPKHPESYGTFINCIVIPRAEDLAGWLELRPHEERVSRLSNMLRKLKREDSTAWWILSANSVRSFLFPGSYTEGTRSDRVVYLDRPKDWHRGKVVQIGNLSTSAVASFTTFAQRMCDQPLDPATFAPIQSSN